MPGHSPIGDLSGPLADHHLRCHMAARAPASARPGNTQRTPGAQTGHQLALERAPALHVERLIDRLMRDTHGLIIREIEPQPVRDLLRAPGRGPSSVLTPRLVPALPPR